MSERGNSKFVVKFPHSSKPIVLVVDANERVCYAYLVAGGRMVADVWLYNVTPASQTPEWNMPNARELMPFKNPIGLGRQDVAALMPALLTVEWREHEQRAVAYLKSGESLIAVLGEGDRPGACVNALVDSPVAKKLVMTGGAA